MKVDIICRDSATLEWMQQQEKESQARLDEILRFRRETRDIMLSSIAGALLAVMFILIFFNEL